MTLIGLIVLIAVIGFLVWAVTTLIPMPEHFKRAIYVVALVILVIYLLQVFGLVPDLGAVRVD